MKFGVIYGEKKVIPHVFWLCHYYESGGGNDLLTSLYVMDELNFSRLGGIRGCRICHQRLFRSSEPAF